MKDAPMKARAGGDTFLTEAVKKSGGGFSLLAFTNGAPTGEIDGVGSVRIGNGADFADPSGTVAARYDATPGSTYLLRPDGYVAARFRHPTPATLQAALTRAGGSI
jgi:3-(3-hydroxy-phenyl)propionate hydroxylase